MAKLRLNPLIQGIHGRMGDLIFRGSANGETVVYKAPGKAAGKSQSEPDSPPHPFKEAHAYARAAMADPEMRAYYKEQARKKNRSAYAMALSGYFEVQCRLGESILEDLDFSPPGEHVRRAGLFNPLPATPTGEEYWSEYQGMCSQDIGSILYAIQEFVVPIRGWLCPGPRVSMSPPPAN